MRRPGNSGSSQSIAPALHVSLTKDASNEITAATNSAASLKATKKQIDAQNAAYEERQKVAAAENARQAAAARAAQDRRDACAAPLTAQLNDVERQAIEISESKTNW